MEEGVDLTASYEDSFHTHHAYSLDIPHANHLGGIAVTAKNPLEEMDRTKRPLEPDDMEINVAKRQKAADDARRTMAAASTNKQWDAMFERLVAYKEKHGHCLVPKRYAEDPKLGTWVETQRVQFKRLEKQYDGSGAEIVQPNKRLNQERLHKLQEIGFAWSAKHVRKQRNNSLMSTGGGGGGGGGGATDATPDAEPMTAAPTPTLLVDSSALPPAAPPPRRKTDPRQTGRLNDQQWEEMYQRLARYKEEHGDCLVPRKYERDPKLSTWVETQRFLWNRDYRNAAGANGASQMDQDRQYSSSSFLESMQSLPEPTHVAHASTLTEWHPGGDLGDGEDAAVVAAAAAAAAEAVDEEVGSTAGSEPMMKDASTLPKRLTKERKEKLDALGFVWSLRSKRIDDHWDEMFRQLVHYKEMHGDCLVPSRYEANLKLGKWVETQRYEYTKLKRAEGTDPSCRVEEKFVQEEIQPGAKPRVTNARLTEERLHRLESIGFEWKVRNKMKRYYDKQWQEMFDQLLEFKAKNGHTMVPKRFPDNPRLANWVHTQRIQYRKLTSGARKDGSWKEVPNLKLPPEEAMAGDMKLSKEDEISFRLTEERRRKLEEIGFVWSVRESDAKADQNRMTRNSYDDLWDAMYDRLKIFKEKYGNCLVPKRSKEDPKLGTWVDTQRVQYKKMKKKLADQGIPFDEQKPTPEELQEAKAQNKPLVGRLTEDRIRRLNELGFVWSLRDDWTKHYEELKQFKKEHGHCNVPARYAKNRRLGIWVSAQRQQFKQQCSSSPVEGMSRVTPLTRERIELLNELGFTWTIRSRDSLGESWNQRLQELRAYKENHGNCLVPSRYPPNPELGIWVGTQRTQYRLFVKAQESGQKIPGSSGMNEERIKQLEDLGFVWALRGQEGSRRDDSMLQDSENYANESMVDGEPILAHNSVGHSHDYDALSTTGLVENTVTHSHEHTTGFRNSFQENAVLRSHGHHGFSENGLEHNSASHRHENPGTSGNSFEGNAGGHQHHSFTDNCLEQNSASRSHDHPGFSGNSFEETAASRSHQHHCFPESGVDHHTASRSHQLHDVTRSHEHHGFSVKELEQDVHVNHGLSANGTEHDHATHTHEHHGLLRGNLEQDHITRDGQTTNGNPQDSVAHCHEHHVLSTDGQPDILEDATVIPTYQNVQEV